MHIHQSISENEKPYWSIAYTLDSSFVTMQTAHYCYETASLGTGLIEMSVV